MNFLIGLLVGLFIYGSIMYYLYWSDTIGANCYMGKEGRVLVYVLIGIGWIWFIPHLIISLIIRLVKKIRKR